MSMGFPGEHGKFNIRNDIAVAEATQWRARIRSEDSSLRRGDRVAEQLKQRQPAPKTGNPWTQRELDQLHKAVLSHGLLSWDLCVMDSSFPDLGANHTAADCKAKWRQLQKQQRQQRVATTKRPPLVVKPQRPSLREQRAVMEALERAEATAARLTKAERQKQLKVFHQAVAEASNLRDKRLEMSTGRAPSRRHASPHSTLRSAGSRSVGDVRQLTGRMSTGRLTTGRMSTGRSRASDTVADIEAALAEQTAKLHAARATRERAEAALAAAEL